MWLPGYVITAAMLGIVFGIGLALDPLLSWIAVFIAAAAVIGFVIGSDRARRLIERALEENE
jgi:Flp pilus assembly protein TadB